MTEIKTNTKADLRKLIEDLVKPQRFAFIGFTFNNEAFEKLLNDAEYVFEKLPGLLEEVNFGACFDPTKRIVGVVAETDYLYIDKANRDAFKDIFCRFDSFTLSQNKDENIDIRLNSHGLWVKENE